MSAPSAIATLIAFLLVLVLIVEWMMSRRASADEAEQKLWNDETNGDWPVVPDKFGRVGFAETGSHPSDQARSGLGASRFDPARGNNSPVHSNPSSPEGQR